MGLFNAYVQSRTPLGQILDTDLLLIVRDNVVAKVSIADLQVALGGGVAIGEANSPAEEAALVAAGYKIIVRTDLLPGGTATTTAAPGTTTTTTTAAPTTTTTAAPTTTTAAPTTTTTPAPDPNGYIFTGANGDSWRTDSFGPNINFQNAGGFGQALTAGSLVDIQSNRGRIRAGSTVSGYGVGISKKFLLQQINFASAPRALTWKMTGVISAGENGYRGTSPALHLCATDLVSGSSGSWGYAANEMRVVSVGNADDRTNIYLQCRVGGAQVYNSYATVFGVLNDLMDFRLDISAGSPCTIDLRVNNQLILTASNIALTTLQNLYLSGNTGRSGTVDCFFDDLVIS